MTVGQSGGPRDNDPPAPSATPADGEEPAAPPAPAVPAVPVVPAEPVVPGEPVKPGGPVVEPDLPRDATVVLTVPPTTLPPELAPAPVARRRWPLRLCLALVGVLVAGAAPVAFGASLLTGPDSGGATAAAPSPRPGDPPEVTGAWLRDRARTLLAEQSAALLRGDEAGFLALAGTAEVRADLRRKYAALRALRVTTWRVEVTDRAVPTTGADGRRFWRLPVVFHHCFVTPDCVASPVLIGTRWSDDGGLPRLVRVERSPAADHGPRPWESGDLVAAAGRRTLVATTTKQRRHLPDLLKWAEQAALVADRHAIGAPPDRYRVFLAGAGEWKRWYGGGLPDWTSGYAIPLRGGQFEVVLNPAQLALGSVADVLRHELTHVSTLPPGGYQDARRWWLVEGLADVAAADGRSVEAYPSLPDVRRFVADGWDGRLDVAEPGGQTPDWQVSARYGVAYLAVRHLSDRFGERDTRVFFHRVVHARQEPEAVSPTVFGEDWPAIRDECVLYIRRVAA